MVDAKTEYNLCVCVCVWFVWLFEFRMQRFMILPFCSQLIFNLNNAKYVGLVVKFCLFVERVAHSKYGDACVPALDGCDVRRLSMASYWCPFILFIIAAISPSTTLNFYYPLHRSNVNSFDFLFCCRCFSLSVFFSSLSFFSSALLPWFFIVFVLPSLSSAPEPFHLLTGLLFFQSIYFNFRTDRTPL